ncbi:MAG TPA: ATP-binding protein [Vicinamibacterales bacterium]|nr:ATP-binding protein [Vicinamibacterales bacterium]
MTPFRDLPIAHKTLILGFAPALVALAFVSVAATVTTYYRAQRTTIEDLNAESALVAENVSAALAFNDPQTAADLVRGFRVKQNVEAVCVFDVREMLFAGFVRAGACPPSLVQAEATFSGRLTHRQDITLGNRQVGSVILVGNLVRLSSWMRMQSSVLVGTLAVALLFAVILNWWLQRSIVDPIESLAATAQEVTERTDYTVRAGGTTNDEVGRLVVAFNAMLERIEQQSRTTATLLEREQEASRLKDQFLASVSHELRTPLNAILGWLQIIRKTSPGPEKLQQALERIDRNAQAQTRVVEDLIDISRIIAGKVHVRTDVVDVAAVLQAAVDVVRPALNAKRVTVVMNRLPGDTLVSGDADRLQQILWNLLSNAAKFTPPAGTVTITLQPQVSTVAVRVEDTGVGIDPSFLPCVFDRFRQADGTTTRQQGGLGLGLAIAKELTELHGGQLIAQSPGLGLGSVFTLILPTLLDIGSHSPAHVPPSAPSTRLDGIRVLVVDDDPDSLQVLGVALATVGADVSRASTGQEAIQRWDEKPGHVLVCDIAIPGIDGFGVWRTIQERTAAGSVMAIAVTAYSSEAVRQATAAAGFCEHIVKPYRLEAVIKAVTGAYDRISHPQA